MWRKTQNEDKNLKAINGETRSLIASYRKFRSNSICFENSTCSDYGNFYNNHLVTISLYLPFFYTLRLCKWILIHFLSYYYFIFFIIIYLLASFWSRLALLIYYIYIYTTLIFLIKKYILIKYNLRNIQHRFYYLINDFLKKYEWLNVM